MLLPLLIFLSLPKATTTPWTARAKGLSLLGERGVSEQPILKELHFTGRDARFIMRPLLVLPTLCHFPLHRNLFVYFVVAAVVAFVNSLSIVAAVAFVSVSLRLVHINCFGILSHNFYATFSWLSCSAVSCSRGSSFFLVVVVLHRCVAFR